jgi:cysteine desulfurase
MHCVGNPSSLHGAGRRARHIIESAKDAIAKYAGYERENVILTSGATESINTVMAMEWQHILTPQTEHIAVLDSASIKGRRVDIPVDTYGLVRFDELESLFDQYAGERTLLSFGAANNETGVVSDVDRIVKSAKIRKIRVHIDAAQAFGRIHRNWKAVGADFISISAHKLGGSSGIGALLIADHVDNFTPLICGGGQQRFRRSGTENVIGAAGFGAAVKALTSNMWDKAEQLRAMMECDLKNTIPSIQFFGDKVARLPNTSCFALPERPSDLTVMQLDIWGYAVSRGSACSSGKVSESHVLRAMGVSKEYAQTAIRVSLCQDTTEKDVQGLVEALHRIFLHTCHQTSIKDI